MHDRHAGRAWWGYPPPSSRPAGHRPFPPCRRPTRWGGAGTGRRPRRGLAPRRLSGRRGEALRILASQRGVGPLGHALLQAPQESGTTVAKARPAPAPRRSRESAGAICSSTGRVGSKNGGGDCCAAEGGRRSHCMFRGSLRAGSPGLDASPNGRPPCAPIGSLQPRAAPAGGHSDV